MISPYIFVWLNCLCYHVEIRLINSCRHFPFPRKNAEDALQGLNGSTIGKQTVRLSWGRNPANKQVMNY
jgi:hypothetical protein